MFYEPLHHKYRPQTFADLVGQEAIATTLTNAIRTSKIAPAYLFTGPRGTGKTSSARILAKSLNCLKSDKPTEHPCGVCAVCKGIANGSALDVIEIDAASNTGVENIRDLIERAQFAPVQCRYKVYVIDECLTGDSLVQTSEGLIRIDDPNIKGKKVLSYNDSLGAWEFKKVVRWLNQGERQTLVIRTTNSEIRCTGDHLVRTEEGWIAAKDVKEGAKILSPVNVDAAHSSTNLGRMDALGDLLQDTSSKAIHTGKNLTTWLLSLNKSNRFDHFALAGVAKSLMSTTQAWAQILAGNGWQTFNSIQSPRWATSLERVESVKVAGVQRVYDIEVVENHNFVANGLLVHNCHMLSVAAFNALLKTLEEPPERVVFVLATTDPQRVLPTIISRCQRFDFRRIPLDALVQHLRKIASIEKINVAPQAVQLVAQVSQGGLRDAESLLDQLSLLSGQVTVERVWDLVGSCSEPDLMELLQAIAQNNPEAVLDCARRVMDRGREPLTVLQNLAGFYRDLLIAKTAPSRSDLVAVTPSTWTSLCEQANNWDISSILAIAKHLANSEVQIKNTTQPRLWLEVALLGLLSAANSHQQSAVSYQRLETNTKKPFVSPADAYPSGMASSHGSDSFLRTTHVSPGALVNHAPTNTVPPTQLTPPPDHTALTSPPPSAQRENPEPSPSISQPAEVTAQQTELEQIWQQVTNNIELDSTRAMLRMNSCLLSFNGQEAVIGSNGKGRLKQIQGMLPQLKKAFSKTFKGEVQVSFQVVEPTEYQSTSAQKPRSPGTGTAPATSPQIAEPLAASHFATTSSSQTQVFNQFQPGMAAEEAPAPKVSESLTMDVTEHAPIAAVDWSEDEVAIASQRLADFFKGEVVKFNLESTFPDSTNTNSQPLIATSAAQTWNDADLAVGEADIDF